MITDSHTHIDNVMTSEEAERYCSENDMYLLASFSDPSTFSKYEDTIHVSRSFGIHPWKADALYNASEISSCLSSTRFIGESGLDSVWCTCDPKKQMNAFKKQVAIARQRNVPLILHTKGQESGILSVIEKTNLKLLVHWFSPDDDFIGLIDKYMHTGAYFTIGPNSLGTPSAKAILETVPEDRILVETDGLEGTRWAYGDDTIGINDLPDILMDTVNGIASVYMKEVSVVLDKINDNFMNFTGIRPE